VHDKPQDRWLAENRANSGDTILNSCSGSPCDKRAGDIKEKEVRDKYYVSPKVPLHGSRLGGVR